MIVLARHGRTTLNAQGRLLGRLDPPLDPEGERQAAAVGAWLAAAQPSGRAVRVVSSPLLRARATAEAVAAALGAVDVEVDERWIELDYGDLDGVPLAEVPVETWARWRADVDFCPEGGECLSALGARVRDALGSIVAGAEAADVDTVVVSHVSPIKAAVAWALGVDDLVAWRLFLAPGSISRVAVRGGVPSLHQYNLVP